MCVWPGQRRTSSLLITAAVAIGAASSVWGQGRANQPPPTPPPNESTDPLLRGFQFRSIGPATMMGRCDDIVGSEKDPMTMYVGFATGGKADVHSHGILFGTDDVVAAAHHGRGSDGTELESAQQRIGGLIGWRGGGRLVGPSLSPNRACSANCDCGGY